MVMFSADSDMMWNDGDIKRPQLDDGSPQVCVHRHLHCHAIHPSAPDRKQTPPACPAAGMKWHMRMRRVRLERQQ